MAMGFGRKNTEEIKTEVVKVWECSAESCNAWVRDNFKSTPLCPICNSPMEETTKELQVVNNNSIYTK